MKRPIAPEPMDPPLILTRTEVARLMDFSDYVAAVEQGFRASATGGTVSSVPLHIAAQGGGFHAKAALIRAAKPYTAVKINGNFPGNPERNGLPTIQGVIVLFDADNGCVLAVMDSIEITLHRAAAATALAARYLARPASATATICGCGDQGRVQLAALRHALPLRHVHAWDIDAAKAKDFADEMGSRWNLDIRPAASLRAAATASDAIVTCTTAHQPFLGRADVAPGTFIAAVGADSHDKSELEPDLMGAATVVADVLAQCVVMGDLHHAIRAGAMHAEDVHGELGELVVGAKRGRSGDGEITIFDSTGTAIEDVASAARVYERASAEGIGMPCRLGARPWRGGVPRSPDWRHHD
ncbi:MAG: ornithine cyclodeaminase family protein [Hyphomicrobiales bacterium]